MPLHIVCPLDKVRITLDRANHGHARVDETGAQKFERDVNSIGGTSKSIYLTYESLKSQDDGIYHTHYLGLGVFAPGARDPQSI